MELGRICNLFLFPSLWKHTFCIKIFRIFLVFYLCSLNWSLFYCCFSIGRRTMKYFMRFGKSSLSKTDCCTSTPHIKMHLKFSNIFPAYFQLLNLIAFEIIMKESTLKAFLISPLWLSLGNITYSNHISFKIFIP